MLCVPKVVIPLFSLLVIPYSIIMADDPSAVRAQDAIVADARNGMADGKKLLTEEDFAAKVGIGPGRLGATKELIEAGVDREIWHFGRICELSDEQLAKLRLSKKGQFHKWLDDVEQVRQKYEGQWLGRDEQLRAAAECYCLRQRATAFPLNPECFFQRVLRKVLTDEQQPSFAKYYEARQRERLDRVWAHWEPVVRSKRMILSTRTRNKVADFLLTNAAPLAKNGEYAHIVVLLQLDQLRDHVEPLMSQDEWAGFEGSLAAAKSFEPLVREMDLWPIPETVSAELRMK